MARTAITVTEVTRSGVVQPSQQSGDASNGMALPWNDGRILLELSSQTGTTIFTFPIPVLVDGQTPASKTVTCTVGQVKVVGPLPTGVYNQSDGTVNVDMDNTTNGRLRAYHI